MSRTITSNASIGILLTAPTDSPVTIVNGVLIESKPDNFALIGGSLKGQPDYNFPWTITNSGAIEGKGGNSTGVVLYGGGKIVNADIGYISGGRQGIYTYYQPATVVNFGTVSAYGTSGTGIILSKGGQVFNAGTVFGDVGGVEIIKGTNATVINYGTIKNRANTPFGVSIEGYSSNYVKNTAYIEDNVVQTGAAGTLVNSGTIKGSVIETGGAPGTLNNSGTIEGSVTIGLGGIITNGVSGSTAAQIDGFFTNITGGAGTINNYGTISGYFDGVDLGAGGSFTNAQPGAAVVSRGTQTNAGFEGIFFGGHAAGTVTNLGTVEVHGHAGAAINLALAGGTVTNGSASVTSAFAGFSSPHYGIGFYSQPAATITNFATFSAANGIFLHAGGSLANTGTAALIYGRFTGLFSGGVATIDNDGRIESSFGYGIDLTSGSIVNGSTVATGAAIVADRDDLVAPGPTITSTAVGVGIITAGSLTNYGSIEGAHAGVYLKNTAVVVNGRSGAGTALLEGIDAGIAAPGTSTGPVTVTNFATIAAIGTAGIAVDLNDAAGNTVSNSGTISGAGGTAVAFGAGNDLLIVRPGAVFDGVVEGGGGSNEIDFHTSGKVGLAPEFIGFARVRLFAAASLALRPADLAGLAGKAITVIDGNAGDTVSAAALTAGEQATVNGGTGSDVFVGGAGKDIFTGGAGADIFDFSAAALTASDTVQGGSGDDALVMTSAGTVAAAGVSGVETWRLASGKPNSLRLTAANFTGTTGTAITVIDGNAGDTVDASAVARADRTTVTGGSGNDVFIGGAGIDFFNGHAGADTFRFSVATLSANDVVKGGDGNDTLFLTSAGTVAATGVSQVETYRLANGGADKLVLTAANFAGAAGATITVTGGNSGNTIDAHLVGAGDHVVMIGGAGKDVFTGGPGNDTFRFSAADLSASDVVKGGGGIDTLFMTSAGTVAATGVSQVETYRLANGGADKLVLTAANFAGVTGTTITVEGGNSGNTVDAHLVGAGDHAVMTGGLGKDVFTGGPGADTFRFSVATLSASDVVKGGGGDDTLFMTSAGTLAAAGVSQVETWRLATGGANKLVLTAGNFAGVTGTTITVEGGNAGNTVDAHLVGAGDHAIMIGGAGTDAFTGGPGNDTFRFSAANLSAGDVVQGAGGNDTLFLTSAGTVAAGRVSQIETWRLAHGGANTLSLTNANFAGVTAATITVIGGRNGNTLSEAGISAADLAVLVGGAGRDILTAGRHARLTGGAGADQFVFGTPGSAASPDANTITDFAHGLDRIVFRDAGFNLGADEGKGTATPQAIAKSLFSPDTNGSFATTANRFAYNTKTGGLFYDADGSGKADASQRIATLTDHPALTAGDLFFIK